MRVYEVTATRPTITRLERLRARVAWKLYGARNRLIRWLAAGALVVAASVTVTGCQPDPVCNAPIGWCTPTKCSMTAPTCVF